LAKGSVVKRSGTYYAVYRVDGKQKWEKAGSTRKTAEKLLANRLNAINTGTFQELKSIRFKEFAKLWLNDYARINVKVSTYSSYESIFRLHLVPQLGNRWLHTITAGDIQNLVARKISRSGLSPKSVINMLVPLKEMYKHAIIWGYVQRDPAQYVKRPRVQEEEMDSLFPDEVQLFLKHVAPKHYVLFLTAVLTGMRRGELIALKWSDIDWNSSQVIVRRALYRGKFVTPKSKYSCRRIVMTPMLRFALEQHRIFSKRSELDLVFCNEEGLPLDPDNLVKRHFFPALDRAGLRRIRFHDLRHTYASLLISMGENVKFIQHQLGHSSAKTTLDRYGHLMPGTPNETGVRLDQAVFGDFVRKMLEKSASEGLPAKKEIPEAFEPQGFNSLAGEGFEPSTFGL